MIILEIMLDRLKSKLLLNFLPTCTSGMVASDENKVGYALQKQGGEVSSRSASAICDLYLCPRDASGKLEPVQIHPNSSPNKIISPHTKLTLTVS